MAIAIGEITGFYANFWWDLKLFDIQELLINYQLSRTKCIRLINDTQWINKFVWVSIKYTTMQNSVPLHATFFWLWSMARRKLAHTLVNSEKIIYSRFLCFKPGVANLQPNLESRLAIFRHFWCFSSGFCYHVAQKASSFSKTFKLRPKSQFGLATPDFNIPNA